MTPAAHIQTAIEILAELALTTKPADQYMSTFFHQHRYIGSKDRQKVATFVYGVLRRRNQCDHWAAMRGLSPELQSPDRAARARMLSYLWQFGGISRTQIGILFSGEKYAPDPLYTPERKMFDVQIEGVPSPDWVKGNYPEWMHASLQARFGSELVPQMEAMLEEAPVDLRVNSLKANREDVADLLVKEGLEVELLTTPHGLRLKKRHPVSALKSFKDGFFEVQDEGSQLIVALLDPQPGMRVCDLCAGAGGKTLAIAAEMKNKGMILATDTAEWRLKRAKERLRRAGVGNTECHVLDEGGDKRLKRLKDSFDRVLIDAPCTGTGTWRRNPDQKWRLCPQDLEELEPIQLMLLEKGARLLKTDGVLVYATCSLLAQENEHIVDTFLAKNPQFKRVDQWALTPLEHNTDGFFAAKLIKTSSEN